jgi:26S proteasome non-ATPase regulatory subunit 9
MLHQTALTLAKARDTIDNQLIRIKDYLESTGLGYKGKLVDREGFPLPDIDHHRILMERQHASRLLNDRKRVEFILDCLTQTQYSKTETEHALYKDLEELHPFAIVDEVHQNSPAEKAGLCNADFMLKFGKATRISDVPNNIIEGTSVNVSVLRVDRTGRNILDFSITPGQWEGNGLVGAHLIPYPE